MATRYSPRIVTDGLVFCLDAANDRCYTGNTSTSFDLAEGRPLTLNTVPAQIYTPNNPSLPARAFYFANAGTKFITAADSTDWDFRGEISWDFVACQENITHRNSIVGQIEPLDPWEGLGLWTMSHDGNGQLAWWGGNYDISTGYGWWDTGISLGTNKWYYCAGTWASAAPTHGTRKVYVRGVGDSSMTTATEASMGSFNGGVSANTFRIGDNGTDAADATKIIDGAIAIARVYNRKLSDAEIDQNYIATKGRFGL